MTESDIMASSNGLPSPGRSGLTARIAQHSNKEQDHGSKVRFGGDARARMIRGVDILADRSRSALGPKGHNVVLDKSYGAPRITKDGVTVAKEIELSDKFENMGAQMVREVATDVGHRR